MSEYIELNKNEECIKYPYIYKIEKDILTWHEWWLYGLLSHQLFVIIHIIMRNYPIILL